MNPTLRKFGYPDTVICEYRHWVVMLRPKQVTFGCVIIASTSSGTSFGDLTPEQTAEFPEIARNFEASIKILTHPDRVNYLGLMMVDPNPHFHVIPRYARDVSVDGVVFRDKSFPKPPNLDFVHVLNSAQLDTIKRRLKENWVS